jgi:NADH-quinone oxidoreductase subunit K
MTTQLYNSLLIGAVLFVLGTLGFLTRRNLIVMFLSAELMLQAVALNLIAFGRAQGNYHGQSFTIFVLTVAACEAGIALVLFLALYQRFNSLDVSVWHELGETHVEDVEPELLAEQEFAAIEVFPTYPELSPAGREPSLSPDGTIIRGLSRKDGVKRG